MIKDIIFVLMVLSITTYAHVNKSDIMDLVESYEVTLEEIPE